MDFSTHPIILIADHKWRDLPAMVLLKTVLEDVYKLPTLVVNYGAIGACLQRFRPRAVALTTLIGPREQKIARAARAIGAAVVVIPSEGIPGSAEAMAGMMRSREAWESCDLYLSWGPAMADFAIDKGYLPTRKVCVTGSARFDFYRPPLRRHLLSKRELCSRYGLRAGSPIVTWATTFVMASYIDDQKRLRMNERDLKSRGLGNTPGFADLPKLAAKEREARDRATEWMPKICRSFSHVEFLIKPHPYEAFEAYDRLQEECRRQHISNFRLISNEYIGDVLNAASVHVHSGSTTGLEAWLMEVPTVNLRPGGYARFSGAKGGAIAALEALDDTVDDDKNMADRIDYYLNGGAVASTVVQQRRLFLEHWFSTVDGAAATRQAAAIARLLHNTRHTPDVRPPLIGRRTPFSLMQYRINEMLGRPFDAPWFSLQGRSPVDAWGQRDKVVRQTDVAVWEKKIRSLLPASQTAASP